MAEDVLNSNMAGLALSDYNGLSESVTAALKERDEMIYKQWIIINELERKLSQYYPLDEFYAGITRHFYHDNGSGEAKNASNHAACKSDVSTSDVIGRSADEATGSDTRPQQLQQQQLQATEPSSLDRFDPDNDNHHHHHHHQQHHYHHYENVELKIHEEEEEGENVAVNGRAADSTATGFTDDTSGCYEVATTSDDILVDETSTNFENLLEEYAASDAIGSNGGDGDDSFNSSQSSSSSSEDEDDDDGGSTPCVFGASNSSSNSGNSTLRKKQKSAVAKVAEVAVAAGSHESLGSVEEHLFGSVSQGGTLRRDHPSISKIFHPSSSALSASSPSVFSSSFSPSSLTSPGFASSPSFVSCPCPDCLGNGSQQRHPLFSQTLHRSNQQQQQQQDYNPASSKASGPIKPLAPLGLEPWRLKLRTLNNTRTYQDQCAPDCQPGHPFATRHPSLDATHHCSCKVQSYSNGNLSTGSNSSLEQQQCQHHQQIHPADVRPRGPTSGWRKTPERMSSGSESLSSVGNLSSCSCPCESSQRCNRCSANYQMLPGYPSPSPSSPRTSHTRFQFPPQSHLQELFQLPVNQSTYHHHNHVYGTVPNHILTNQAQHHHQHQQHYHHQHQQQQIHHQRLGGVRTDFYHAPSTSHARPGQGVMSQGQVARNVSDRSRKRAYRIGLNIFNKKPARGIEYLIENKFLEPQPNAVAKFLISRKGVSRKMIGQYMGNIKDRFSMEVLKCFSEELDLTGLQIDVALRVYQSQFEISGEAQRIEKFMEAFASRYRECNPHLMGKLFRTTDSMFVLSYAIMMLNTDLHNVNIKPEKKMTLQDFIKNLKGSDDGSDINGDYLSGIYERMKEEQFSPLSDHTTQVVMVDRMIQGKKESLVETHRRFVCHFRMHEVHDVTRNERIGSHSRGLFLFNDLLIVTKLSSKKKKNSTHHLKHSVPLLGVAVYLLETPHYKFGIRLKASSGKVLVTLCANNHEERMKFVEDLRESILETEKMEEYLGRVKVRVPATVAAYQCKEATETLNRYSKDSGVVDVDLQQPHQLQPHQLQQLQQQQLCKYSDDRRSSRTSVDSGMSSTGSANLTKDVASSSSTNNNNSGKLNRSLSQKGANLG